LNPLPPEFDATAHHDKSKQQSHQADSDSYRRRRQILDNDFTTENFNNLTNLNESLNRLEKGIIDFKKPLGSKDNPARSCRDLLLCSCSTTSSCTTIDDQMRPIDNGEYWIDPNQGSNIDAFKVFCNFTDGATTCFKPLETKEPLRRWLKPDNKNDFHSFSDLESVAGEQGFKFTYTVSKTQLVFLRLLSTSASQRFIYLCDNSSAWYSHSKGNFQGALRFEGSNGDIFSLGSTDQPQNLYDNCQSPVNGPSRAEFLCRTDDTDKLPLVDFKASDFGGHSQQFGFELGEVCFQA
jgi:collagen type V/XI/XXIV/XXVII alpha